MSALYKKPGDRHWWANVVLSDGHTEQFDTEKTDIALARARARVYAAALCKQRGVKTPKDIRREEGILSGYKKTKANKAALAAGKPPPFPVGGNAKYLPPEGYVKPRIGRPPGSKSKPRIVDETTAVVKYQSGDQKWANYLDQHAKRSILFTDTVIRMLVLGVTDDPQDFVANIRALIVETMGMAGYKKKGGRLPI